jgi:hypothetical protein
MKIKRINKAIDIIEYAIKNQQSVKEASVMCGYSDTYVKNVKAQVIKSYENGMLDDVWFNKFNDAYKKYEKGGLKFPIKGHSIESSIPINNEITISHKTENKKPIDLPSSKGEKLSYVENGDVSNIEWVSGSNYPPDHVKTLDELLKATKIDTKIWKVKDFVVNKWDVTAIVDKVPQTFQNWQVKARLERDNKVVKERMIGDFFKDMIENYEPPVFDWTPLVPKKNEENNLLEISIFDLHIGKLAWGGETGENYDTKIARGRFIYTVEKLLQRATGFEFSRILFPVGSDFFNSDNIFNTTTKGTPQDEDLRWQKTFNVGVRLLVDAINMLTQTGVPVDVVVIPGNHDFERSYYMGAYLEAWFNNHPTVCVNNGASPRKYYRFGKVLLGLTHGNEEKEASLPMLMATDIESKPMWSETKYHEWHIGHQHHRKKINYTILDRNRTINEDLGVTVRYLSSLTGIEQWHHKKGLLGPLKAGDAFIWNDEAGLIANLVSNIIL